MKDSIIKRYPGLKWDDVMIQDNTDGKGPFITYWNHPKPMPSMEDILKWVKEDEATYVPTETTEQKVERLEKQLNTTNKSLMDLWNMILGN